MHFVEFILFCLLIPLLVVVVVDVAKSNQIPYIHTHIYNYADTIHLTGITNNNVILIKKLPWQPNKKKNENKQKYNIWKKQEEEGEKKWKKKNNNRSTRKTSTKPTKLYKNFALHTDITIKIIKIIIIQCANQEDVEERGRRIRKWNEEEGHGH